jgi:excisionase family DNA binding protein
MIMSTVPRPSENEFFDESFDPRLISVHDLATILKVSQRTIWRLLSAGKLVKPIRLGGVVRWRYDEIQRWISDNCPPPNGK